MPSFEALTPAERARQLCHPEGAVGLAVAGWLNESNRQANQDVVALLGMRPGQQVLEIGFGNGHCVPGIAAAAPGIRYTGLDISPTMVAEASRFNAALIAAGRASFHLGAAERMPFADGSFDRVFSIGVIHFWADPAGPLAEVRRVLRPGGRMLMLCLAPHDAPDFALPEYGFHLRAAAAWEALCRAAGFARARAETVGTREAGPDGTPVTRHAIHLAAQAGDGDPRHG